ncbi:hypothetical protein [Streptomyces sp. NPDC059949]|uniref:hypothetical protein n=1 Tax=Streptomyces sp. NPDC059949 TaxID=3347013 RepID=UPI0036527035
MSRPSETDALWARLSPSSLAAVAAVDAERLEAERAGVSARVAQAITTPVYSVRHRFEAWEGLGRESGPGPDEFYAFSEYENDLDSRDGLEGVMAALPAAVRAEFSGLLAVLDARFTTATKQDATGSLDPWLRAGRRRAPESHFWWWRAPKKAPW